MWGFYRRWLKTAVWHGLGVADLWSGLVGALIGVVDHYWPHLQLMPLYGWQIPIWIFAAFIVGRLVMAPYWMWQEDQEIAPAKVNLVKRRRLAELRATGVKLRNKGARLDPDKLPAWLEGVDNWRLEAIAAVRDIDDAEAEWFAILDAVPDARVPVLPLQKGDIRAHLKAFREHDYRLVRLEDVIKRYGRST